MLPLDLYESESFISHGVAGTTFKACKVGETQEIAVKVVSLAKVENDAKVNLIKAIRSLKGISHPNVLTYTNVYVSNRSIFIEMKLMQGKSLSDYLLTHRRHGTIPEAIVKDIIHQIAKGLDCLHKGGNRQLVHGNLTPRNIFYDSGTVTIADYGLHPPLMDAQSLKYVTTRYPSPPELSGDQYSSSEEITSIYTNKTDIWMLGNLIIELCTYGTNAINSLDVCTNFSNYSPIIKEIVSECLHKDPSKRPSAADIALRTGRPETGISNMTSLRTSSFLNLGASVQMSQVLSKEISLCGSLIENTEASKDVNHKSYTSRLSSSTYCNNELNAMEHARARYCDFVLVHTPSTGISLMVARHILTDDFVYLEVLNVKRVSAHMLQRYMHNILQIRNNPCANVIAVNHYEQIGDLYICEMKYSNAPSLQSIVNEYLRVGVSVPEELVWSVLLDICAGLLHLRSIGVSYGLLSPANIFVHDCTMVISNIAISCAIHKADKGTGLKAPLHGIMELAVWMTNLSTTENMSKSNLEGTRTSTYSHNLITLIKYIEKLSTTESISSPVECLTVIRDTALEHTYKRSIRPLSIGAPKQLLALIDNDNQEELKRYIECFNSCPSGALMSAINKQKFESIAIMCREISRRSLSTRISSRPGRNVYEPTPLMKIACQGDICCVSQNKEHLMARYNGITALMISAYRGKHKCLTNLLSEIGIQSWSGTTALMFAADRGHEKCVKLLLPEMGIQRHDGMTALMLATQAGNAELVELLQQEKDLKNSDGLTAYDIAVDKGLEDCIKILAPHKTVEASPEVSLQTITNHSMIRINSRLTLPPGKFSNLMLAASSNNITSIRKYVNEEAGQSTIEGKTALMFAAELGNAAAVRRLAKAEGGMLTTAGDAAIFMAIQNNNHECVAILQRYEGKLTNKLGETPVQFAERLGYNSCVASLTNAIPLSQYPLEQHTDFTENRERFPPMNQASMINAPQKSLRAGSNHHNDSISEKTSPYNKNVDNDSTGSYAISHDGIQDATESCISQIDKDDKSTSEIGEGNTLEQPIVEYGSIFEQSAKTKHNIHMEDTDTGVVDGSELPLSKRHSYEANSNPSDEDTEDDASCNSVVQTGSGVEKKSKRDTKEKDSNKKEKGNGKSKSKGKNNISKSRKAYLANNGGSDSASSSESTLVDEDLLVDIDAELARGVDPDALNRKIVSLETSGKRKSKKPRTSKIKTKLMLAVEHNDQESFKLHLKDDARKSYNGLTALMLAIMSNNLPFIHILSYYESTLGQPDGTTALMMASEKGLIEATSILIEKEAGVLDKRGNTALLRLLESPPPHACIQMLAKAEGRIARKDGQTPLMVALERGIPQDIAELTLFGAGQTNKAGQTALMIAAANGRSDYIEKLIPSESRMSDKKGMTALMYAAAAGNVDCIKILVDHERGMQTKQKLTALHYAVESNRVECVKLLLFTEEDIPNAKGQRCLAIAKMKYFHECARLLSQGPVEHCGV